MKTLVVRGLLVAAALLPGISHAKVVARDIDIVIDKTSPDHASDLGKTHDARIFYDDSKIDPVTHHVRILHEQHTPMHIPFHPDAVIMPVANAWLDLSSKPYRYHLAGAPDVETMPNGKTMWDPYFILFDEDARRMTIRKQSDGSLELSGLYTVGEKVYSGPDIDWVIYGKGPPKNMPKMPGMPGMGPGGPGMVPPPGAPQSNN